MGTAFKPESLELTKLAKTGALGGVPLQAKYETPDLITFGQEGGPDLTYPKWYLEMIRRRRSKE